MKSQQKGTLFEPGALATQWLMRQGRIVRKKHGSFLGRSAITTGIIRGVAATSLSLRDCPHREEIADRIQHLVQAGLDCEQNGRPV